MLVTPGTTIDDRYEVLELLGEGGMATVFKAREAGLERVVALKMLHAGLIGSEEDRQRFHREGLILSTLCHANILSFYRFGIWHKTVPYIAMEYLEGITLRQAIQHDSDGLALSLFFQVGEQVCDAMQFAHRQGIVHRDLTPANIMLTGLNRDVAKIVDFGLSRLSNATPSSKQHLTQTGELIGSPHYMSPEQCSGMKSDHRSDIYSLGCVLYHCLAGEPPLDADNPIGLMQKHVTETPPSITRRKDLPAGLEAVLFKAMSKQLDDRYQSMEEFKHDLQLVQRGEGSQVEARNKKESPRPNSSLKKVAALSAVTALIAAALFMANQFIKPATRTTDLLPDKAAMIGVLLRPRTEVVRWNQLEQQSYYRAWLAKYGANDLHGAAWAKLYLSNSLCGRTDVPRPLCESIDERHERPAAGSEEEALLKEALTLFIENIQSNLKNQSAEAYMSLHGLVSCCQELGATDLERRELSRVIKVMPVGTERQLNCAAYCNSQLADLDIKEGKYEQALKRLNAPTRLFHDENEMILRQAICLRLLGKEDEARKRLQLLTGIISNAQSAIGWQPALIEELMRRHEPERALEFAREFEQERPPCSMEYIFFLHRMQAQALVALNKPARACQLLERTLKVAIAHDRTPDTLLLIRQAARYAVKYHIDCTANLNGYLVQIKEANLNKYDLHLLAEARAELANATGTSATGGK